MEWLFKQLQNATDRLDQEDVNLKVLLLEINSTLFLKVTFSSSYKNKVSPVCLLSFRPVCRAIGISHGKDGKLWGNTFFSLISGTEKENELECWWNENKDETGKS